MKFSTKPLFIIKKNLQKSEQTGNYFDDVITEEVLQDVCYKLTGEKEFDFEFVDNEYEDEFLSKSYNKGRIATLRYKSDIMFISFSEKEIGGRNSSVQSIPTAFNIYYNINYPNKKLYYYFLDHRGNAETDYLIMIYRLMKTIGFKFLNMSKSQKVLYDHLILLMTL